MRLLMPWESRSISVLDLRLGHNGILWCFLFSTYFSGHRRLYSRSGYGHSQYGAGVLICRVYGSGHHIVTRVYIIILESLRHSFEGVSLAQTEDAASSVALPVSHRSESWAWSKKDES